MSLLLLSGGRSDRLREGAGWLVCGAVVLAVHGGALAYMLREPPIVAADEPAAVMIELAEMPVAPEAEPSEAPPGPQMMEAEEKVEEEIPPDPLAEEVEDIPPPPEPLPEEEPLPEVAESPAPDIEVPLPPPPPLAAELTPPEKTPEPPKEPPKPRPKPKPREKSDKPPAPRTTSAPAIDAARSNRIAAPSAGAATSNSRAPANWRSRLMGHLNRYKRYPAGESGSGKARVAFSINRSGQVLSARLVGSSGNPSFDQEAVSMVRRASPLPAPPPEVPGGTITFTVPVDFTRR